LPGHPGDLNLVASAGDSKIFVTLSIEGVQLEMQVDTGASVAMTDEAFYSRHLRHRPLTQASTLRSCTGAIIPTMGQVNVSVQSGELTTVLSLVIARGSFPSLLGETWIRFLRLNLESLMNPSNSPSSIMAVQMSPGSPNAELLSRYPNVFVPNPIRDFQVSLHLEEGKPPTSFKAREPPIPIRQAIEKEIQRLVDQGLIMPVLSSRYATPIVAVPKQHNEVRICAYGDFSITVNPRIVMAY